MYFNLLHARHSSSLALLRKHNTDLPPCFERQQDEFQKFLIVCKRLFLKKRKGYVALLQHKVNTNYTTSNQRNTFIQINSR